MAKEKIGTRCVFNGTEVYENYLKNHDNDGAFEINDVVKKKCKNRNAKKNKIMKNIYYEFIAYVGSVFTDENGKVIEYEKIKNNFYELNGRKGKIIHQGYTSVYDQGYSGGYDNYGFVFQDNLKTKKLSTDRKTLLKAI